MRGGMLDCSFELFNQLQPLSSRISRVSNFLRIYVAQTSQITAFAIATHGSLKARRPLMRTQTRITYLSKAAGGAKISNPKTSLSFSRKSRQKSMITNPTRFSISDRGKSTAAAVGALREPEEMQRCPYLHEMKERLLSQPTPTDSLDMDRLDGSGGTPVKDHHRPSSQHHHHNANSDYPAHNNPGVIPEPPEMPPDSLIGTVVKVSMLAPTKSPARAIGCLVDFTRASGTA